MYTIQSAIKQAKPYLTSTIIIKVNSFGYVIYFLGDALLALRINWEINNTTKWVNSAKHGAREMDFTSLDGGNDDEHNGAGVVWYLKYFWYRTDFWGMISFDSIFDQNIFEDDMCQSVSCEDYEVHS